MQSKFNFGGENLFILFLDRRQFRYHKVAEYSFILITVERHLFLIMFASASHSRRPRRRLLFCYSQRSLPYYYLPISKRNISENSIPRHSVMSHGDGVTHLAKWKYSPHSDICILPVGTFKDLQFVSSQRYRLFLNLRQGLVILHVHRLSVHAYNSPYSS